MVEFLSKKLLGSEARQTSNLVNWLPMWLKIYQAMITMGGCTSGHVLTPNQFKKRLKYLAALGFVSGH